MTPAIVNATWRAGWVLYAGLGVCAALLLGKNAVPPADVVAGLRASPEVRAVAWAAWIVLTLPVARASLVVPTTYWLRSLPAPRAWFWLVHGAILAGSVELPVALLLGVGGDWLTAASVALAGAAAHALLVARSVRPAPLAAGALLAAGFWLVGAEARLGAAALLAAPVALAAAHRRAPELAHVHRTARVFGAARVALASAHLITLWRRERGTLLRGALIAGLGGAAAGLALRNNEIGRAGTAWRVLLGVGGATLPLASLGAAVGAWRSERRHRWLLDATGTDGRVRVGASAGVAMAWGALLGGAQAGVAAALAGGGEAASTALALALATQAMWGAALAGVMSALVRRLERDDRRDGERVFAAGLAVAIGAATGAALAGPALVLVAAGATACVLAAQATAPCLAPDAPPAPVEELR